MKSFFIIASIIIGAQLLVPCSGFSQARLVLNGGLINVSPGTFLVIDNPAANAITRNSGHIIGESETANIRWNMGTSVGNYVIPWGYGATDYIPVSFSKSAGSGSGYFLFSTYHTPWNNISQLPAGVINLNGVSGSDNSIYVSDRFWKLSAQSYATRPGLTNLEFTYRDDENTSPNTIIEANLKARRYNDGLHSWTDNLLTGSINTATNKLTVPSIDATNMHSWWVLGTLNGPRYWVATSNSMSNLSANWSESSGGAGNAGVPMAGDSIVFDNSSSFNCLINSDLNVASINVTSAFNGSISQGNSAINLSNSATFSGGSFIGGTANIAVDGNFTVSGSSFSAPSGSLNVKGNFNVSAGSFVHNNGTVAFSGTNGATQQISSTQPITFNNITVTNSAVSPGVSIQSNQNLKGILTLDTNVVVDADGTSDTSIFTLLSSADAPTQDAAIAALPSGAHVNGKVTVQRFMTKEGPNGGKIYRYISSPVQNGSVADLQGEIPVSGKFTGKSVCCGNANSLFYYREHVPGTKDKGYAGFPAVSNTELFQPGRGYAMLVRGDLLTSTAWDLRGTINSGNVAPITIPVTYTSSGNLLNDGWNLVGNPFPSTIDWNAAAGWNKSNLQAAMYVTDNAGPSIQFAAWNGVTGTNGGSRYIATGQGFWVKATGDGAPILQANENVKAPGQHTTFFRESSPSDLLRITLVQGAIRDETVIHFREDATEVFDAGADALKFYNGSFNLSSEQPDGSVFAINSLPSLGCTSTVKLRVESVVPGNYKMNFSEYESFKNPTEIMLEDSFTGKSFNITSGQGYAFVVTTDPASYGTKRFKIRFSSALSTDFLISGGVVCHADEATLTLDNSQPGVTYEARSAYGHIYSSLVGTGGRQTFSLQFDSLASGDNIIIIRAILDQCSVSYEKTVTIYKQEVFEIVSVVSEQICREGTSLLKATGAPEEGYYNWYETELSSPFEDHDSLFTTPTLSKTKTYYVSTVNSLGCEGPRKPVTVNVVQYDDATIHLEPSGGMLISNYPEGNQWSFNGKLIENAVEKTIIPGQAGTYGLDVSINGCTTSAKYDHEPVVLIVPADEPEAYGISIFPNPVDRDVTINVSDTYMNVVEMKIISPNGQIVRDIAAQRQSNEPYYVDMASLPTGIYILRVIGKDGAIDVKLLKN
jgi:hypothetical protein